MSEREEEIRRARGMISDARLVAFLRAAREVGGGSVFALELVCGDLDEGRSLDEIFYDGSEYGYTLSVRRRSERRFRIRFGCHAGPLAGDGGEWEVTFDGEEVQRIDGDIHWVN